MPEISKCHYRTANGRLVFEIGGGGAVKDIFEAISEIQEIFEARHKCGKCGGENIRFKVREVMKGKQTYKYYNLQCTNTNCHARFDFGQNLEGGGLFPKWRKENGEPLPNGGWYVYQTEGATA
jgi:hypothetical protein